VQELDVTQAHQGGAVAGLLDHLRAQIHAEDLAGWPHPAGGEQAVQARPAAHVEGGLAGANFPQAERVADAAERFGHGAGEGVNLLRVVALLLGTGGADRELPLLFGRAGDLGEALLHSGTDCCGGGWHGLLPSPLGLLAIGVILREGPTTA
jgi:hypothetical protein